MGHFLNYLVFQKIENINLNWIILKQKIRPETELPAEPDC
jgi:hypothetical protein